jgi:hypothetical protein
MGNRFDGMERARMRVLAWNSRIQTAYRELLERTKAGEVFSIERAAEHRRRRRVRRPTRTTHPI